MLPMLDLGLDEKGGDAHRSPLRKRCQNKPRKALGMISVHQVENFKLLVAHDGILWVVRKLVDHKSTPKVMDRRQQIEAKYKGWHVPWQHRNSREHEQRAHHRANAAHRQFHCACNRAKATKKSMLKNITSKYTKTACNSIRNGKVG